MTIEAGGKIHSGNISVVSVPWEGTRCSVTDRLTACVTEILTGAATGSRLI